MNMRFDGVIRERFMWILLGNKKDICTVVLTDEGVYIIKTGKMGAVIEIPLGAVGAISEKQYQRALAENEAQLAEQSLSELAQKRPNAFIPLQDIVSVELTAPKNMEQRRQYNSEIGPKLVIRTAQGKHNLVFRTRMLEDVEPLAKALESSQS